jgi:ubiquinone/menaquinone biosynthesis C-methylase UbiE
MTAAPLPLTNTPLRPAGPGVLSALPEGAAAAPYDRHAAIYDRLIGSRTYNRLMWGCDPRAYTAFAAEAVASSDGPFLDAGSGTAVFTAEVYRRSTRPLVLVDRSEGMLGKAAERLGDAPATLVQADLTRLPFSPAAFATVGCFGVLHVLDEPWEALAQLHRALARDGRLYASMLVVDRPFSRRYHRLLQRRGEVGPARTMAELASAAREQFTEAKVSRTGAMAWLRAVA